MTLVLNADETMLVESVTALLSRSAPVEAFRALRDEGGALRFRRDLWREMAEMGLPAIGLRDDAGEGFGLSGASLVMEACGRTLAASPLASAIMAGDILRRAGHNAAAAPVEAGSRLIAVALADGETCGVTLAADNKLHGDVRLLPDGCAADAVILAASRDGEDFLILLDTGQIGMVRGAADMIDFRDYCALHCDNVAVGPANILANGPTASALIARAHDIGALLGAAELMGIARECFDRTIAYLKTREQFGVLIGTFQALQHRAARLFIDLELARSVLLAAMRAIDADQADAGQLVSHAKHRLAETAGKVIDEAIQMHGGIGVTDEMDLGLFMKRARMLCALYGDSYTHRERLARERFGLAVNL